MLGIFLNLQQTIITGVLLVMIMSPGSAELSAGWWIEQERSPALEYQIVRVKASPPAWLLKIKALIKSRRVLLMRLLILLLSSALHTWFALLKLTVELMPPQVAGEVSRTWVIATSVNTTLEVGITLAISAPAVCDTATSYLMSSKIVIPGSEGETQPYQMVAVSSGEYITNDEQLPIIISNLAPTGYFIDSFCQQQQPYLGTPLTNELITLPQSCAPSGPSGPCHQKDVAGRDSGRIRFSLKEEKTIILFYNTLSEKDKRRYAAVESMKLGHGGQSHIASILGCSTRTIRKAIKEFENGEVVADKRVRKKGGGRKPYHFQYPDIDQKFVEVLKNHTAGDPMKEEVIWTNLSVFEISKRLEEEHGIKVSKTVIYKLLKKHKYGRRKAQKRKSMKETKNRNEQFENTARRVPLGDSSLKIGVRSGR